jgi:hypothetical protein
MLHVNVQFVFLEFVTWSSTDKFASGWGLPLTSSQSVQEFSINTYQESAVPNYIQSPKFPVADATVNQS